MRRGPHFGKSDPMCFLNAANGNVVQWQNTVEPDPEDSGSIPDIPKCCGGGIGKRSYQSGGDSSGRATASLRTALIVTGDSLTVKNTTM